MTIGEATVSEQDFELALNFIRDLRQYAVEHDLDPWAVRQALVMGLEFDTLTALKNPNLNQKVLDNFDGLVRQNAKELAKEFEAMERKP